MDGRQFSAYFAMQDSVGRCDRRWLCVEFVRHCLRSGVARPVTVCNAGWSRHKWLVTPSVANDSDDTQTRFQPMLACTWVAAFMVRIFYDKMR